MRPCVLFVEDETITHAIGVAALVHEGFRVLGADSTKQALDALADTSEEICALIADVHLAGSGDGFDLARRARALRPDLALLVMSGRRYPDAEARLPLGARFLQKPVAPTALVAALRTMIGSAAPLRRLNAPWLSAS